MRKILPLIILLFCSFITSFFLSARVSAIGELLFSDNFEDASITNSKWDFISGTWIIDSGYIQCSEINNGNPIDVYILAKNSDWTDYSFSYDIFGVDGVDKSVYFRFLAPNHRYSLNIRSVYSPNYIGDISLGKQTPNEKYHELIPSLPLYPNYNNKWYKIKINVVGSLINIYIDNSPNPIISYIDPAPITHGKIGLKIWPGSYISGSCTTTTRFDNVELINLNNSITPTPTVTLTPTPTPTPTSTPTPIPQNPIVFVPGHSGSWNTVEILTGVHLGEWKKVPYFYDEVYGPFLSALENKGYTHENKKLYEFYYNWLQKTDLSSDQFDDFITNTVLRDNPGRKVNIVAHSYGGLVTRNFLQRYQSKHPGQEVPIEKLITVGTPHEGVLQTYGAWEGGEIWDKDLMKKFGVDLFLVARGKGYLTKRDLLHDLAPSTIDLFPIFNFLYDKSGSPISNESMIVQNIWLKNLKANLINNPGYLDYFRLYRGYGFNTLEKVKVSTANWAEKALGLWPDGKPISAPIETTQGDGMVLLKSSALPGLSAEEKNLDHGDLIKTEVGVKKIFELLNLGNPIYTPTGKAKPQSVLSFILHSPACLRITDNENRQTGCQTNSPSIIPNSDKDEGNELVLIVNPQSTQYKVELIGQRTGDYTLTYGIVDPNNSYFRDYSGETYAGEKDEYIFSKTLSGNYVLNDPLNKINLLSIKQKLQIFKEDLNNSNFKNNYNKDALIRKIDWEIERIDYLNYLLFLGDYARISEEIRKSISRIIAFRPEINNIIANDKDKLYLKDYIMEMVYDYKSFFLGLPLIIDRDDALSSLINSQNQIKALDKKLSGQVKSKGIEDKAAIYLACQSLYKEGDANFYLLNYKNVIINTLIIKNLFTEIY